ncbi:MAG: SDR family NAD(P)-dependent oxidoreductase [Verrucomicrobia bacterium]|nr:SDR family NAD(P)-dependent oxidoreductase [Verrucomicrobiota bacterium]
MEDLGVKRLLGMFQAAGYFRPDSPPVVEGEIARGMAIQPRHARLLRAFLEVLAARGLLRLEGDRWVGQAALRAPANGRSLKELEAEREAFLTRAPEYRARAELLWRCAAAYAAILKGEVLATDVIYPNSSMAVVEGVYQANSIADCFHEMVADRAKAILQARAAAGPAAEPFKILELGAGIGATTGFVLRALDPWRQEMAYTFTDISLGFLQAGEARFAGAGANVEFRRLDLENDPIAQGLAPGSYDLIIASNVVHATRRIRDTLARVRGLLKPGGLLLLNEITQQRVYATLTFALLDGWWLFEDPEMRLPGGPMLSCAAWERALGECGFSRVDAAGSIVAPGQESLQHVILAASGTIAPRAAGGKAVRPDAAAEPARTTGLPAGTVGPAETVLALISRRVTEALRMAPGELDVVKPFSEYGLDSVLAVGLVKRLNADLGLSLKTSVLFDHVSVNALAAHIESLPMNRAAADVSPLHSSAGEMEPTHVGCYGGRAVHGPDACANAPEGSPSTPRDLRRGQGEVGQARTVQARGVSGDSARGLDIAIVGMAGRFPDAADLEQFWENLAAGHDAVREIPKARWDVTPHFDPDRKKTGTTYCKWGGALEGVDQFDAAFFSISGREAEVMDPQQRLFLEACWHALEDAGYTAARMAQSRCGVFVGAAASDYATILAESGIARVQAFWGNAVAVIASRIAYFLNLKGPAVAVDTACSSSLVSLHMACQSLRAKECEMALAGGVFVNFSHRFFVAASQSEMLSPTGACRAFDEAADGFAPGEGVGAVLLKRLEDAERDGDPIHAVIRGSAMNQDGRTNGLTAPSARSQTELECEVYDRYGIDPRGITCVEAHGTGTKLGDPIEIEALTNAFRKYTRDSGFCAIGSVKTNIGHAATAAGVAGLLKAVLALKHRQLPPSLHFHEANGEIRFEDSPFFVNTSLRDWALPAGTPRRAAVSSFGFSGTNVHLVVEESPEASNVEQTGTTPDVATLSARTERALRAKMADLGAWLSRRGSEVTLGQVCFTLNTGRDAFAKRVAFVVASNDELVAKLTAVLSGQRPEGFIDRANAGRAEAQGGLAGVPSDLLETAWKYVRGDPIDWDAFYQSHRWRRVPLPLYPFQRRRYWPGPASAAALPEQSAAEERLAGCYRVVWRASESGPRDRAKPAGILVLDDSDSETAKWEAAFAGTPVFMLLPGASFERVAAGACRVRPESEEDYRLAFECCAGLGIRVTHVALKWDLNLGKNTSGDAARLSAATKTIHHGDAGNTEDGGGESSPKSTLFTPSTAERNLRTALSAMLAFAKALIARPAGGPVSLLKVHRLASGLASPVDAAVAGFLRSLTLEQPRLDVGFLECAADEAAPLVPLVAAEWRLAHAARTWVVRWEGGRRWRRDFDSISGRGGLSSPPVFKHRGVYVIVGGAGAIGLGLAELLAAQYQARLILASRSAPGAGLAHRISRWTDQGADVEYVQSDVGDREQVQRLVEHTLGRHGRIDGIVHAAGVLGDSLLADKTIEGVWRVIRPKCLGAVWLDEATCDLDLDWTVYFSSLSAELGSAGQTDYAAANAFLDAFAAQRERWRAAGTRSGRTVSINWPLWRDGGMHVSREVEARRSWELWQRETLGMEPLAMEAGWRCLEAALAGTESQVLVAPGEPDRVLPWLQGSRPAVAAESLAPAAASAPSTRSMQDTLIRLVGEVLKIDTAEIEMSAPLSEFGFDSLSIKGVCERLDQELHLGVAPNLFFALPDLASVCRHLEALASNGPAAEVVVTAAAVPGQADADARAIAVVGVSGVFPGAPDLDAFWKHLRNGDDLITEIPPERWDWRPYFRAVGGAGKSNSKWGGFIADVDRFDAEFFGISEREAELMDPQHRFLLEQVWLAVENSGESPLSLSGKRVGVFVGIQGREYLDTLEARGDLAAYALTGNGHAMAANRISFFLNLSGPSEAIDTACSSSLVALHRAVQALRQGECDAAIVGGVSLMLNPKAFAGIGQLGVLSPDGRCKTFDASANGYVRGEGVGALYLKSLAAAELAGHPVWGVIRGSAVNHGGRATSVTAPNKRAQAELIATAWREAGWDPRSVGFVEVHGTGTELGDPVEVDGLKAAVTDLLGAAARPDQPWCVLGSVKTNIGHLEPAAGIAGVIKVLLAMKHRTIPASLHLKKLNPYIDLANGPFRLATQTAAWTPLVVDGATQPLRAGVSSFGFGGANAHVAIESYAPPKPAAVGRPFRLIALSARQSGLLRRRIAELRSWLERDGGRTSLGAISRTTCAGRAHFEHRSFLVVDTVTSLREGLSALERDFDGESATDAASLSRKRDASGDVALAPASVLLDGLERLAGDAAAYRARLVALGELYTRGADLDWEALYRGETLPRAALPGYPFARRRYWAGGAEEAVPVGQAWRPELSPGENRGSTSTFTTVIDPESWVVAAHVVQGRKTLPGVACLELVRLAAARDNPSRPVRGIAQVVWTRPLVIEGPPRKLEIVLEHSGGGTIFTLQTHADRDAQVHVRGRLLFESPSDRPPALAIGELECRLAREFKCRGIYDAYRKRGMVYGPAFQALQWIRAGEGQALGRLACPHAIDDSASLSPSMLDGAIQAVLGMDSNAAAGGFTAVPFGLELAQWFGPIPSQGYTHVVLESANLEKGLFHYDVVLVDLAGEAVCWLKKLTLKSLASERVPETARIHYLRPVWMESPLPATGNEADPQVVVVLTNRADDASALRSWLNARRNGGPDRKVVEVRPGTAFRDLGGEVFEVPPGSEEDFDRLFARLTERGLEIRDFIQGWAMNCALSVDGAEEALLAEAVSRGVLTDFALVKACLVRGIREVRVVHACREPFSGLAAGWAKSICREQAGIRYAVCSSSETWPEKTSERLAAELAGLGTGSDVVEVRYAGGKRLLRSLEPWSPALGAGPAWREGGVYLITGGAGGLGWLVAARLTRVHGARVVLAGRSSLGAEKLARLERLRAEGAAVEYIEADISKAGEAERLVESTVRRHGGIHGIIHAAGILRDGLAREKSRSDFEAVLAPKVAGTWHLVQAARRLKLDAQVFFSSMAGEFGNIGQSDYAAANAFMDRFAAWWSERGQGGVVVSINWPWWREGGMPLAEGRREWIETASGLKPLATDDGLAALETALIAGLPQLAVLPGTPTSEQATAPKAMVPSRADIASIQSVKETLVGVVARLAQVNAQEIDEQADFSEYGFDSIGLAEFSSQLNRRYGIETTPVVFFEFPTVAALAGHLVTRYPGPMSARHPSPLPSAEDSPPASESRLPSPSSGSATAARVSSARVVAPDAIAVIGMSGVFPKAPGLESFWRNLADGIDGVSAVPPERWEARDLPEAARWGGFIDGVDLFDAEFFGITPLEAELMDPQQRLFLRTVWETFENAGLPVNVLRPKPVGLFVGVATSDYATLLHEQGGMEAHTATGISHSILANRVSYLLNFTGPSEAIDTACSSSLVAVHRAAQSILDGECELAVAGGVNLILTPATTLGFIRAGMLAPDGRCKTFDQDASGYVRGEGVGAVLLKRLVDAERDGDPIHGVILATAVNHGGRVNSLTAPNPVAQAEVVARAWRRSGVGVETIGFIEAHGTGTRLGDPVEVQGLKRAFESLAREQESVGVAEGNCAVGSVKTQIGHLETAAGIAGLIKALLVLKAKVLPGNLHLKSPNPLLELSHSAFRLLDRTQPWPAPVDRSGRPAPRRAGVSSFGFGGTNAHVALEEAPRIPSRGEATRPCYPVAVSAKTQEGLRRRFKDLLAWLGSNPDGASLSEISFTLNAGRDHFGHRAVVVVSTVDELVSSLERRLNGEQVENCRETEGEPARSAAPRIFRELMSRIAVELEQKLLHGPAAYRETVLALVDLHLKGCELDWRMFYGRPTPRRLVMPGYPFAARRYWLPQQRAESPVVQPSGNGNGADHDHGGNGHASDNGGASAFTGNPEASGGAEDQRALDLLAALKAGRLDLDEVARSFEETDER